MKTILKVMTCGNVDDGKSTLMGRLLFDSGLILKDQSAHAVNSRGEFDYSLLFDGLSAEQEQNITIDVSYKYFYLNEQKIIIADCPGHIEFIRNMATAASNSDAALLVIDVTKGITDQTVRHLQILKFFQITKLVVAINKMDLINYNEESFHRIVNELKKYISSGDFGQIDYLPVSAVTGEGLCSKSLKMKNISLKSLSDVIFQPINPTRADTGTVLLVQGIHLHEGKRYLQLQRVSGKLKPSLQLEKAGSETGQKIDLEAQSSFSSDTNILTMLLRSDAEMSRGDVLVEQQNQVDVAQSFNAQLICLQKIEAGKNYIIKLGFQQIEATFENLNPLESSLDLIYDATGFFHQKKIVQKAGILSEFIVIDRINYQTVAVGFIRSSSSSNRNAKFESVQRSHRQQKNGHKSFVIWFSGLSGAGKTTLAQRLEKELFSNYFQSYLLDADQVRSGLSKDLDFSMQARNENIRRLAEVAKILSDSGQITIVTAITPLESQRELIKQILGDSLYHIHLSTPLSVCEKRDIKGLYQKARAGLIPHMTGISSPFEDSKTSDLQIDTSQMNIDQAVSLIYQKISKIF